MRKFTSALLLISILAALSACGGTEQPAADTTADTTPEETLSAFEQNVPKADFGGAKFRIVGRADGDLQSLHVYEMTAETENGDVINDAVYARNMKISDYLNVEIVCELSARNDVTALVQNAVMSGDDAYDLVWNHMASILPLINNGLTADFHSFDAISLDKPWWNQTVVENFTIGGKLPLGFCDIPFTAMLYVHCMFVNKSLADEYLDEDIYTTVSDGRWTMDKLLSVTSDMSRDVNGDGAYDGEDSYGFMASYGEMGIFTTSGAAPILDIAADGSLTLRVMSERMQDIVDKSYKLAYDNNSSYVVSNNKEKDIAKMFAEGKSLFYSGFLSDPLLHFRDMKDDFALIPFPKYDEAQDSYRTTISGGNGLFIIPKTVQNTAMVGAVTDALAYESYQTLRPAVLETVMVGKLLRDEESVRMFNTIIDGIHIDFGWLYHSAAGFGRILRDLTQKKSTDLASYVAQNEAAAMAHYQSIIELYTKD